MLDDSFGISGIEDIFGIRDLSDLRFYAAKQALEAYQNPSLETKRKLAALKWRPRSDCYRTRDNFYRLVCFKQASDRLLTNRDSVNWYFMEGVEIARRADRKSYSGAELNAMPHEIANHEC